MATAACVGVDEAGAVPDLAMPRVAGEFVSDGAAAAGPDLRAMELGDAVPAVADDVGSGFDALAGFCGAELVPEAEVLFEVDAGDGPVEAGGGGAIQIPDSDASSVGWAHDPEAESAFAGVDEVVLFVAADEPGAPGGEASFGLAGAFDGPPTTGGIPKPAGEVGFSGNEPSGSNN